MEESQIHYLVGRSVNWSFFNHLFSSLRLQRDLVLNIICVPKEIGCQEMWMECWELQFMWSSKFIIYLLLLGHSIAAAFLVLILFLFFNVKFKMNKLQQFARAYLTGMAVMCSCYYNSSNVKSYVSVVIRLQFVTQNSLFLSMFAKQPILRFF